MVCLEQTAEARTKEDSSCRARCPDVETPLKTETQLQELLLEVELTSLNVEAGCHVAMPGTKPRSHVDPNHLISG